MRDTKLDMRDVKFKGDVLDVAMGNYGVIYNIIKDNQDEISIDYISEENKGDELNNKKYETAVIFFSLSKIWNAAERKRLLFEIWQKLDEAGELYIWDYEKKQKEVINEKVEVKLPNNIMKSFNFNNRNPFSEFSLETSKKILEKYYEIEETRVCNGIIYLKAKRKGILTDESITNSSKLKIHSQQFSSEIFKSIHKGFRISRRDKGIFHK